MKIPRLPQIAHLFGAAVLDQIVLSGANFLASFLLIRRTSDADYGLFVLVQAALALLVSAQSAWLTGPLTLVVLKKPADRRREMVGAANRSQSRNLRLVAAILMVVPGAMFLLDIEGVRVCAVSAIGILAGWAALRRDFIRSALLMYRRPHAVFGADLFYVTTLLSGVAYAAYGPGPAAIWAVAALTVSAWCGTQAANREFARDPGWGSGDAAPVWREIRTIGIWTTIGALFYWLFAQSYNYVLATRLDLSAVAAVNAVRLLIMPTMVLTIGVTSMLIPLSASWLGEISLSKLLRRLLVILAVIALLDLAYIAFVWFLRDWMTRVALHKTIANRDRLLVLWAAVALIALLRDMLTCALFALGTQRSMAWLIGASAAVALSVMWTGLDRWGPPAVLIGQIAGESVNVLGLLVLLNRSYRRSSAR
jgi:O-antigen/teichoic acid export membrane protein